MSAYKKAVQESMATYPWEYLDTRDLNVGEKLRLNTAQGNVGEVIYNNVLPEWKQITQLTSLFTDNTDGTQNVCGGIVAVDFNKDEFNDASIGYASNKFTFNKAGTYKLSFECVASNADCQFMISFFVNGSQIYGLTSVYTPGAANPVPFTMSTVYKFIPDDYLEVFAEKITGGPSYLTRNPIYGTASTQLYISAQ